MNGTKRLTGACAHCGKLITFAASAIGTAAQCPFCGEQTELKLAAPETEPSIPRRTLVWTLLTIVILVLGLIGALVALDRAQDWAKGRKPPSSATPGSSR